MGRASPTPPISSLLRALKVVPSRLAPPSKPLHAKKPSWSPAYLASSPPPGKAGPAQQQEQRSSRSSSSSSRRSAKEYLEQSSTQSKHGSGPVSSRTPILTRQNRHHPSHPDLHVDSRHPPPAYPCRSRYLGAHHPREQFTLQDCPYTPYLRSKAPPASVTLGARASTAVIIHR